MHDVYFETNCDRNTSSISSSFAFLFKVRMKSKQNFYDFFSVPNSENCYD